MRLPKWLRYGTTKGLKIESRVSTRSKGCQTPIEVRIQDIRGGGTRQGLIGTVKGNGGTLHKEGQSVTKPYRLGRVFRLFGGS